MRTGVVLLTGLIFFVSCSKDTVNEEVKKSPAQLLTQQQWLLTKAGFDANNNGLVDAGEDILDVCQKDNIYTFSTTGVGSITDNGVTCGPPNAPDFSWKFLNDDKELQISFQKYFIRKLNETDLVISPDLPLDQPFILTYRH